jgi:predicted permease
VNVLRRFLRRLWHSTAGWHDSVRFQEELDDHVERQVAENLRAGLSPQEARRQAVLQFGPVEAIRDSHRDEHGLPVVDQFVQDVRYAVRSLRRAPGFTTIVLLTLGLGIGATAAMFSVVDAVLIRPLPFRDADRLVSIGMTNPVLASSIATFGGPSGMAPNYGDFFDLQRDSTVFSSLMTFETHNFNVTGDGLTLLVGGASVSGSFFETLGLAPGMGRTLGPGDALQGSEPTLVISHWFWRTRLHSQPDVLSRSLTLDGVRHRIVGVMPPYVRYPGPLDAGFDASAPSDLWVGLRLTPTQRADRDGSDTSAAIARLRPGVSLERARAETASLFVRYDRLRTGLRGWTSLVGSVAQDTIGASRRPLWLLLGGVSLLMLIACGNTANLFFARTTSRARELSVRTALGAGRGRLLRQLLTESVILAGGGGAVGWLVAFGAIRLLPFLDPGNVPRLDEASIDWRVFAFGLSASLAAAVLFGLLPSLALSRGAANSSLLQGWRMTPSRQATRIRHALIVSQVSLALVLLAGAALLIRSYVDVLHLNRGFSSSTMTMSVVLPASYGDYAKRRHLHQELLENVRRVPGILSAGEVNTLPLTHTGSIATLDIEGRARPERDSTVDTRAITGDYFAAMGTPLLSGRLLTEADATDESTAIIVNRAFEQRYFPGESALGKRIRPSTPNWMTIVGVVADVRHDNLEDARRPQEYRATVHPLDNLFLVMRTEMTAEVLTSSLRKAIQDLDPTLGIGDVLPMSDRVSRATALRRFQMSLLAVFAILALGVAAIGLYGVMAYSVRQRTMEIGIRMALGASLYSVLALILGQGLKLTLLGLALGLAGAFALTRLMRSMLYGVSPTDPVAFAGVCLVLVAAGVLASYLPARRATRVDPVIALRSE